MPFDDAAEAKCADSESEDEYVESRLERVLREEAGEAKPEAPRYTQLDDELLSDMQRGDEQMRRLVRHRLNKQREAADEKVCRQLLRKERFERGMRKGCIDNDEKLAALAQREEVEEVRAEAKQREDEQRVRGVQGDIEGAQWLRAEEPLPQQAELPSEREHRKRPVGLVRPARVAAERIAPEVVCE